MEYKSFVVSATLSLATTLVANNSIMNNEPLESLPIEMVYPNIYTNSEGSSSTYSVIPSSDEYSIANDAMMVLNFANSLIESSKPLDNDISKLINDNIMDLLS